MSILKFNIHAAFVALAVLMASSQPALAETKTLLCTTQNSNWPSITVDLNEAKSKVTFNWGGLTMSNGLYVAGRSEGTFHAAFDSKSIVFDINKDKRYDHYRIDRLTGALELHSSIDGPFDQAAPENKVVTNWTCEAGKAKF